MRIAPRFGKVRVVPGHHRTAADRRGARAPLQGVCTMLTRHHAHRLLRAAVCATVLTATCCQSTAAVTTIPTAPPTRTPTPTVVASTSTSLPPTSSTSLPPTSSTTVVATTSTTVPTDDQVKSQIAADYVAQYKRRDELVAAPTLDGLETSASDVEVPGSEGYDQLIKYVQELVAVGDRVVPNDKDPISMVTVEQVNLTGAAPYTEATVTYCRVNNTKRITPPDRSPTGQEVLVFGTGVLRAFRGSEPVKLTEKGWLPFTAKAFGTFFEGQTSCPPA